MMLSDTKLLKKLKESLAKMAAPLQEDARIFQNKITEASERLEVCIQALLYFVCGVWSDSGTGCVVCLAGIIRLHRRHVFRTSTMLGGVREPAHAR